MLEAVARLADRWRNLSPGSTIDVAGEFTLLTLNVLALTIFADGIGGDFDEFSAAMCAYFGCIGRIGALDLWACRIGCRGPAASVCGER
jgi:hypothetical protein